MNWYKTTTLKKISKYINDECAICEHCGTFLQHKEITENNKHLFNIGFLYTCSCGKSRIWTNSIRDENALADF